MGDILTESAVKLGLRRNYFFGVRRTNIELFKFMYSFGDTMLEAYPLYLAYVQDVVEVARDNYSELEHRRQKAKFGKVLVEHDIYQTHQSYTSTSISLFSVERTLHYTVLKKLEKSNALFEQFIADNPIKVS